MVFNEILPAYDFCKGKGLDAEADKIKQLLNTYIDLAIKEHKIAVEKLNSLTENGSDNAEKETKE